MTLALPAPGDTPRRPLPRPVRVAVPGRALVLVAGVPGAGKSTLLRSLPETDGQRVLDSEEFRRVLGRVFPGVAYARLRPLVHLAHRVAVAVAASGPTRVVVVHLPATSGRLRRMVLALSRATSRSAHLVWVDAAAGEALRGQVARGRVIERESFARHAARAEGTAARIAGGRLGETWDSAVVVDRRAAARGLVLEH
jgi:predicted kinase